jgi:FMN phosphatase YigB (HAD superfamily)
VVTFDFWDTLVCAPSIEDSHRNRTARVAAVLAEAGVDVEAAVLEAALVEVRLTFDERWEANQQFTAADAARVLTDAVARQAGAAAAVDAHDELVEALATTRQPPQAVLTANVAEVLADLRERGVRVGIVCDVGLQPSTVLRGHLEGHGVLGSFDHWSFSDEVGCYKPNAPIFEHALAGLGGVDPSRAAHVGDLRRTDVAGARGMGMTAVRYRGRRDDPGAPGAPEGHHVIDDHAELLEVLGLT